MAGHAPMTLKLPLLLCSLLLMQAAAPTLAAPADPAAAQVQTLNNALLKSMHAGESQSMSERFRALEPVIEQVFDLPLVTRLAVGPTWTSFTPEQQKAVIAAFGRFTTANYAHNFRDFDGQKFEVDENVLTRAQDKVVRTRIIPARESPQTLLYRMHDADGTWKIVDVYSNGVSELALRRSDFAAALAAGGAPELIAHLNKASDGLMK